VGLGGFWGWPYYWGYPYAYWPGYYGSYLYDTYPYSDYGYGGSGYGYVAAPSYQQAAPPVVIEQNYSSDYQRQPGESFYRHADYYLIAFNDHTIQAALSFWVEGEQIHWITREHEERQAPLSTVDRRFSEQINRDRRVEFRLP